MDDRPAVNRYRAMLRDRLFSGDDGRDTLRLRVIHPSLSSPEYRLKRWIPGRPKENR
jgi:hypothetical protein